MAGNFNATRPFIYVNGNIIDANENNPNETTIYAAHNGSMNEITGHEHTGAVGDAPKLGPGSVNLTSNYDWTGIHTFLCGNLRIHGLGVGVVGLCYENSAANRTHTIPDTGANAIFIMERGVQTITGIKTFSLNTFVLGGAGAGVATVFYENTAANRSHTVPDAGANDTFAMLNATQTLSNKTYNGGTVSANIAVNAGVTIDGVDISTHVHTVTGISQAAVASGDISVVGGVAAPVIFTVVVAAPVGSTALQGLASCSRWRSDGGMNFNGNNFWQVVSTPGFPAFAAGNWTFSWTATSAGDGPDNWTLTFVGQGFVFNGINTSPPV